MRRGPVPAKRLMYYGAYYITMPTLTVRRAGNSLVFVIPAKLARGLGLRAGEKVDVEIRKVPTVPELLGTMKGAVSAEEFTRLSNEGEDLG